MALSKAGWFGAGAVVAATLLAYAGSYSGPFVFDDRASILANPSIQHLSTALSPPAGGFTVSGRPLLNFSLAINYAISGTQVWSYHAVNVLIHVLAALTLFGILRRTANSLAFAFAVALLWAVHPLQTESVTYVVQRAESLMGLFYLQTLYWFIRQIGEPRRLWAFLSIAACFLGMATKEVMVTAPIVVLLYDRTFVSASFLAAVKERWQYYAGLAATWVLLALLVAGVSGRGGTAGFATGIAWWDYGITQFRAIPHYLWLCLWPHSLVFDYGAILEAHPSAVVINAAGVVFLAAISIFLCVRRNAIGYLGVCFFLILLPSSSVLPVPTETVAEHRMYLSLAAFLAVIVSGVEWLGRKLISPLGLSPRGEARLVLGFCVPAALALGLRTYKRNEIYGSARTLWSDSVNHWPSNARAHNNLGMVLLESGDLPGAEAQFRATLALNPEFARANSNLGHVLAAQGRWTEAADDYRKALRFLSADPELHEDLGSACLRLGQGREAAEQYSEALRLNPGSANAHFFLGVLLDRGGDLPSAATHYRESLRLEAANWQAWYNLATLLARSGQYAEAAPAYASAVRLNPDFADAHVNYGNVLARLGRAAEAAEEFRAALRLQPNAADARAGLDGLAPSTQSARGSPSRHSRL